MSKPNRLALFDCDGTLVDSQHSIVEAMSRAFTAEKLQPPSRQQILSIVGLSLPYAMARLLPEADADYHDHLSEQYKAAFRLMRQEQSVVEPLYAGMADLLHTLDEDGWMLGVATGKSDRGLNLCLTHHGLLTKFVTLQTADRHPSKPHPSMALQAMAEAGATPETTVMIGDTSFDMELAGNAGVRAIGVTWGYHSETELRDSGASAIAVDMDDLARHIAQP
ncbi:MAG: HAD family hydrolase [Sphingobium sp.]|nr:HAD family hydrolase [Sphingobium sp.]